MKLSNLFLSIAVMASVCANAQTAVTSDGNFIRRQSVGLKTPAVAKIADNQRYVGNEIDDYCNIGFGIQKYTGSFKCGGMIAKDQLTDYIGCKIVGMRFYLCEPVGKSTAFVSTVVSNGYINDSPLLSKEVADTHQGWNEVMFDYSYTIGESSTLRGFMVGYTFEQIAEGNPDSPIAVSGTGTSMGFMIYGDLDNGLTWYNMGTSDGNLMVQLIVEREGGFIAYDVAMDQFLPGVLYAKAGETRSFGFYCRNVGTSEIAKQNVTFGVSVDGTEVGEFCNQDAVEAGEDVSSYVEGTVTMPGDLSLGSHDMSVYVKSVNGAAPEGNLANDRLSSSFKVYAESFPRQKQLVEQFTSQYCVYCPRGYDVLNGLAEKRGDLAWIAYHGDMGANQIDEYTLADSYNFMAFSCGGNLPAASVNRYYYDYDGVNFYNTVGLTTAYPSNQKDLGISVFDELINMSADIYPSFTTVDIASSFDAASRQLTVKVSGKTAAQFAELFGDDAALSVYLTEDGLWGKQKNNDRMMPRYPHDHTLRMYLTSPYGDALGAADGKYEKTFVVTLDGKWVADNMNVIAVVSRPMKTVASGGSLYLASKGTDLWVDNAETVKLGSSTTGISAITPSATAAPTRVYTLDGTYVGASADNLPKGIYIVNGRKIVK